MCLVFVSGVIGDRIYLCFEDYFENKQGKQNFVDLVVKATNKEYKNRDSASSSSDDSSSSSDSSSGNSSFEVIDIAGSSPSSSSDPSTSDDDEGSPGSGRDSDSAKGKK